MDSGLLVAIRVWIRTYIPKSWSA